MLENMNRLLEKMDALNKSLSIYAPKHNRKIKNVDFQAQLEQAQKGQNLSACSPATSVASANDVKFAQNLNNDIQELIQKYSKEYNVDANLIKQLISVASGNNPSAVGTNGQVGLMQINPALLSQYGVTNPFDPAQNISAGTQHLSQLLQNNSGNLPLALASYNTDPFTVKRFGGVPPYSETQNFVNQILSGLGK